MTRTGLQELERAQRWLGYAICAQVIASLTLVIVVVWKYA